MYVRGVCVCVCVCVCKISDIMDANTPLESAGSFGLKIYLIRSIDYWLCISIELLMFLLREHPPHEKALV